MKKIFIILLLFLQCFDIFAQQDEAENQTCFWFNVKVSKKTNAATHIEGYDLRRISAKIYSGSSDYYKKSLWKGLAAGTQIAVGPFYTYQQAALAVELYNFKNDSIAEKSGNTTYFWFLVKPSIMQRSHSYVFERMAARVTSGTAKEFSDVLKESLAFKTLAIGPFSQAIEAENSKQTYRLEE